MRSWRCGAARRKKATMAMETGERISWVGRKVIEMTQCMRIRSRISQSGTLRDTALDARKVSYGRHQYRAGQDGSWGIGTLTDCMEAFRFNWLVRRSRFVCSSCRSRARVHTSRASGPRSLNRGNNFTGPAPPPAKPATLELRHLPTRRVEIASPGQSTLQCLEERGFVNQIVG